MQAARQRLRRRARRMVLSQPTWPLAELAAKKLEDEALGLRPRRQRKRLSPVLKVIFPPLAPLSLSLTPHPSPQRYVLRSATTGGPEVTLRRLLPTYWRVSCARLSLVMAALRAREARL